MLRQIGTFIGGLLIGLLTTGLLIIFISEPRGAPVELLPVPTSAPIRVHVAGAVVNPGVYELPPGSIVREAIDHAGGTLDIALTEWINLAATLKDGEQIVVPKRDDTGNQPSSTDFVQGDAATEKININTASAPELETLPGIGPSLAQKIVDHRLAHGPFQKPEDILAVSGIGPAKFEQIQDLICVR